jgi:hypothetical protein
MQIHTARTALVFLAAVMLAAAGCKNREGSVQPPLTAGGETSTQPEVGESAPVEDAQEAAEEEAAAQTVETGTGGGEAAEEAPTVPEGKEELVLKAPKATMAAVKFSHAWHAQEGQVGCDTCHHAGSEMKSCGSCHKGAAFKTAFHKLCLGCHKEKKKGPTACAKCHAS